MGKKNKNISEVFSSNSLSGKRCFLLAGGPSLKDFDYSILSNEFTIGINKTFMAYSPTINYSMDLNFYNYITQPGITQEQRRAFHSWNDYEGYKVFLKPKRNEEFAEDIYLVNDLKKKVLSLDIEQGIYSSQNSGFGALMLAIALGCKEIYLLGYDLKISNRTTHWHRGYPKQEPEIYEKTLKQFMLIFNEFAPFIKENGIEVFNLSRFSALDCFERRSLESVLTRDNSKRL